MKCTAILTWNDDENVWIAKAITDKGESVGLILSSGSFDALVERVKTVILEMLDENYNYIGEVELDFAIKRKDNLRPISWQPRESAYIES